jgi:serine/threonine protein kinase
MAQQAESVPPSIIGYTYERFLGPGGFADVFVYRQDVLDRSVAIKVLRETVDDENARRLFVAEANLMARMSAHTNIVSIFSAGVSADQRPYMVMELYPLDHFGKQLERAPLHYQRVLEIGIKIAGAVEVAHRARIIHRDIKPANILANDYGEPGLTDFGISAVQTDTHTDESLGFSPPYAPKEILQNTHPGDARSDVYSLAASLWAMLAGVSPFERRGVRSTKGEIMARAMNEPVPALPAGVAPAPLEAALRQALEKDPDRRPQSARAFAQTLQGVENELGLRETRLVLLEDRTAIDTAVAEVEQAIERTKKGRGVVVDLTGGTGSAPTTARLPVQPSPDPSTSPAAASIVGDVLPTTKRGGRPITDVGLAGSVEHTASSPDKTRVRFESPRAGDDPVTTVKPVRTVGDPSTETLGDDATSDAAPTPRSRWLWAVGVVGVVAIVGVVVVALGGGGDSTRPPGITSDAGAGAVVNPGVVNELALEPVRNVTSTRVASTATFTWSHEPRDGMDYVVQRIDAGGGGTSTVTDSTLVIDGLAEGETPCIIISARVQGVAQSEPSEPVCAAG